MVAPHNLLLRSLICTLTMIALPAASFAQDAAAGWPKQPIKIVVGFAPGGGNDIVSRIIAQKLNERLGVPVLIENRPGASGFIAADIVARSAPDGYTLFSATMGTMVIARAVYSKLPYDPLKSFTHVGIVSSASLALVVDTARGLTSIPELVAYTKANPDKSNYGSSSPLFQLPTELFKSQTGARVEHIPFKGSTEVTGAMLNGQVLMAVIDGGPILTPVKAGKLRLLATTGAARSSIFPETPTLKELGFDVVLDSFVGFIAAAGTPPAIVKRYETEFAAIRQMPDVQERLKAAGQPVAGGTAQEMTDIITREIPRWSAIAKAAHIQLD